MRLEKPLYTQAAFVGWRGMCCSNGAVHLVPDDVDPAGMREALLMRGTGKVWGGALTGSCGAGGYWALPLQWLTTSIVNNEFLDGQLHAPCKYASCS